MSDKIYWYSKLQVANDCLHKYDLQFNKGIPLPSEASGDLEFGTAVHAALNAALNGEDAQETFNVYWNTLAGKELTWSRFGYNDLAHKAATFIERFEKLHLKHLTPNSLTDTRLSGTIGGFKFEGTPDFVGDYKGKLTVLDFKTSGYVYDKRKIDINEQMYIYASLASQALNKPIEQIVYMVFVKNETRIQVVTKELDNKALVTALLNVAQQCQLVEDTTMWPQNRNSCIKGPFVCPFYKRCHE